ncbi:MAG: hypothetical protein ACJLTB_01900 [Algoriphagus aquaeductus]|jgi:hypothetical protein|uniref:hypothetical protein n=1 Tax=Algoriphagus TaxID=246875 RepID=UPI00258D00DE|nr:hypothetical protein [Algoriphagus sp.]
MATIDKIKSDLIDKIISIQNRDFLKALDVLVSANSIQSEPVKLSPDQKIMLEMSERDIKKGRLIDQDALEKRNMEWLNEK